MWMTEASGDLFHFVLCYNAKSSDRSVEKTVSFYILKRQIYIVSSVDVLLESYVYKLKVSNDFVNKITTWTTNYSKALSQNWNNYNQLFSGFDCYGWNVVKKEKGHTLRHGSKFVFCLWDRRGFYSDFC